METREWYEQFNARRLEEAEESGRRKTMARLCGKRLGRSLTEVESAALVTRLDHLGEERVAEVILSSSSDALSTWLADPNAK